MSPAFATTGSHMLRASLTSLALLAACGGNAPSNLHASKVGELIEPSIDRGNPLDDVREACGSLEEGGDTLLRHPYLQNATSESVTLMWTSAEATESMRVSTVDGELVVDAEGVDETTLFLRDATQRYARIGGLTSDTIYCYSLFRGEDRVLGPVGFRTAPEPETAVDFVAFGDSGSGLDIQNAVRDQILTVPADFMIHLGDVAYEDGTLQSFEDYVFFPYAEIFQSIPFFPVVGNHDIRSSGGGPYYEVFDLPTNGGPSALEERYSFDWGPVHLAAFDSNGPTVEDRDWLAADLEATDRPWKIVFAHHPMYSSGDHGSSLDVRALLEDTLVTHGVQLYLAGHDHDYERTTPQRGVTHIVTGGGGRGLRAVGSSEFTAFSESVLHLLAIHADETELRVYAIDGGGDVFDSLRLTATP